MKFIIIIFFFSSLVLFVSVYVSPESLSYTGLMPLLIPFFLILNIFLIILLLFGNTKLIVFPIIALIVGWKFFPVTFQWNQREADPKGVTLLSFNAMHFLQNWANSDPQKIRNAIEWAKNNPADIKCFQEFQQDYTTPSLNALQIIGQNGKYEYKFRAFVEDKRKSKGLAIFSRYPIINEGTVFDTNHNNGSIFVDLKIEKDTIRVYNTHLESMSIQVRNLKNVDGIRNNYRETIKKLKNGIVMRSQQIKVLMEHIESSPYPVILAGDFNDVPYSYTYFTVKSAFKNAFEEAGRGFGFTYNKVLFFLRIDHIFTDSNFEVKNFETHREVDYSDHYPISAVISWKSPLAPVDPPE